jgi:hypothetical protein
MSNKVVPTHTLTKQGRKQLVEISMLGAWALFQFSMGHKIYGLFIIAFFIILTMIRSSNLILVAIPVVMLIIFNTSIVDSIVQLERSNLNSIQNYQQTLAHIFTPNSGREVLPGQVRQMLSLLISNHVTNYQLSHQLYQDPLLMERIVESAWPIKMDSASSYRLSLIDEPDDNSACIMIDHTKEVVLANCH